MQISRTDRQPEQEELFCHLFQTMAQGVIFLDRDENIVLANPAARMILETDPTILTRNKTPDWDVVHEDGTPFAKSDFPATISLRTGGEVRKVIMGIPNRKEGRKKWIMVNATPLFLPYERKPFHVHVTIEDITEMVKLKQELEKALRNQKDIATFLQRALFPDKLTIGEGYRIADRYIPASRGCIIGGDIYDAFRTKTGKVIILIGDVSGKGLETTAFAAIARNIIRAYAFSTSSVAESLICANEALCSRQEDRFEFDEFITVFLMAIDLKTGEFEYGNAGHLPPAIWRNNNSVELLSIGQLPLGIDEQQKYETASDNLHSRDKILLYTDGLTEARHKDGEFFGEENMIHFLQRYGHYPPDILVDKLADRLTCWTKEGKHDDTALVIVERH